MVSKGNGRIKYVLFLEESVFLFVISWIPRCTRFIEFGIRFQHLHNYDNFFKRNHVLWPETVRLFRFHYLLKLRLWSCRSFSYLSRQVTERPKLGLVIWTRPHRSLFFVSTAIIIDSIYSLHGTLSVVQTTFPTLETSLIFIVLEKF